MSSLTATEIVTLTVLGGIAGFALGFLAATPQDTTIPNDPKQSSVSPDWTLAPCAWWSGEVDPILPPYTITNECVEDDGTVSIAPDAIPGGEQWTTSIDVQLPIPGPVEVNQ